MLSIHQQRTTPLFDNILEAGSWKSCGQQFPIDVVLGVENKVPTGKIDTTLWTAMGKLTVGICQVSCSAHLFQTCSDLQREENVIRDYNNCWSLHPMISAVTIMKKIAGDVYNSDLLARKIADPIWSDGWSQVWNYSNEIMKTF